MAGEDRERELGDMNARIAALERAVAQLLTDRDRMFGILDEIRQTSAVVVHRINDIANDTKDSLKRCAICQTDLAILKQQKRARVREEGGTSGFRRALNPLDKSIGQLAGEILIQALKVIGVGAVVALIVLGVGAMP
jgi:hypothetical protein